ncbi:MAG: amidinotransferase [Pseudonocardia sp.]
MPERIAVPENTSLVSSHNEWDPLEEVIIGTARGAAKLAYEPSLSAYYAPHERGFAGAPYPAEDVELAERQLDALAALLEREGVVVRRPDPIDQTVSHAAPGWSVTNGHAQTCPRDVLLVVGDRLIEAPMAQRGRFFEYRSYRGLVTEYFRSGARWLAAPRPQLDEQTYVEDYSTHETPYDFTSHPALTEFEPCFDAASFTRCGRDIFCQPDMVTNQLGIDWLARSIGEDYRVHTVEFHDRHPQHIDTTLVPLRPGLALTNPERPFKNDMAKYFKSSDWRLVDAVPSVRTGEPTTRDVSNWISTNILMLNPETVITEKAEEPLIELFRSLGLDVITTEFDAVFQFGGSFHCCSLDVRRRGELQDHFG